MGVQYKILVVGDGNTGKTSLINRFCHNKYDVYSATVGIDFNKKILTVNEVPIQLQIWDTAGQERFDSLTPSLYRGAHGILLVYDVTNLQSFKNIVKWIRQIRSYAPDDVVVIMVGNQIDDVLNRVVQFDKAKLEAKVYGLSYLEVSCKEDVNIENTFVNLAEQISLRHSDNVKKETVQINKSQTNIDKLIDKCCSKK